MLDAAILILCVCLPSIVLHELAHGLSALWLGDKTAQKAGRLTLNPIKHLDPVGSLIVPGSLFLLHYFRITQSLFLFGWAKPVPVDFTRLKPRRLGMVLVAASGPLTNIAIAWCLVQAIQLHALQNISFVLGWGIILNLTLAVFNLVPIPPLDGSRILFTVLPKSLAIPYAKLESYGLFIVIILVQMGLMDFIYPVISHLAYWIGFQI